MHMCTHTAFLPSDTSTQQQESHMLLSKKTPHSACWRHTQACNMEKTHALVWLWSGGGMSALSCCKTEDRLWKWKHTFSLLLLHRQPSSEGLHLFEALWSSSHKTPAVCLQTDGGGVGGKSSSQEVGCDSKRKRDMGFRGNTERLC